MPGESAGYSPVVGVDGSGLGGGWIDELDSRLKKTTGERFGRDREGDEIRGDEAWGSRQGREKYANAFFAFFAFSIPLKIWL